ATKRLLCGFCRRCPAPPVQMRGACCLRPGLLLRGIWTLQSSFQRVKKQRLTGHSHEGTPEGPPAPMRSGGLSGKSELGQLRVSQRRAHRVAANAGYIGEHFIYHREMESFPPPMRTTLRVTKKPPSKMSSVSKFFSAAYQQMVPQKNKLGLALGLCIPLAGTMVFFSFVSVGNSAQDTSARYEMELERQRAQQQVDKAMQV
ncbi:unnamed protein product, partial [Cladocopium goreaui]